MPSGVKCCKSQHGLVVYDEMLFVFISFCGDSLAVRCSVVLLLARHGSFFRSMRKTCKNVKITVLKIWR